MGDICSSNGFPSLATVVDLFRERPRNRDCRFLFSGLGVDVPSLLSVVLLPRLLMRKKFLSFGKCPVPLLCLFEDMERPEKLRFSEDTVVELFDPKSWVIVPVAKEGSNVNHRGVSVNASEAFIPVRPKEGLCVKETKFGQ